MPSICFQRERTSEHCRSVHKSRRRRLRRCGYRDWRSNQTLNGVHWVRNDTKSVIFFGSPFLGGPRDSLRGQSISTMNLGVFKDTKLGERVTLQLQVQAFNVLNTQYLGNPDP